MAAGFQSPAGPRQSAGHFAVASNTKHCQVLSSFTAQSTSRLDVMDLKILHVSAPLAPPPISLRNCSAKLATSLRSKPQAWPLCSDPSQSVTCTFSGGVACAADSEDQ